MCMKVSLLVMSSPEVGNRLGLIDILSQVAPPSGEPTRIGTSPKMKSPH
jgi:hypothetical protein